MGIKKDKGASKPGKPGKGKETGPAPDTQTAIGRLSEMVDLVYFMGYIGRKTKYGKEPHTEAWGYTRQMLHERGSPIDPEAVINVFEEFGIHNEVEAAEWVVLNDKH